MALNKSLPMMFFLVVVSSVVGLANAQPASTIISQGSKLRLKCAADTYHQWCKFIHNNKTCNVQWMTKKLETGQEVYSKIRRSRCTDFNGRAEIFFGSNFKGSYRCTLELRNVTFEGNPVQCLQVDYQVYSVFSKCYYNEMSF